MCNAYTSSAPAANAAARIAASLCCQRCHTLCGKAPAAGSVPPPQQSCQPSAAPAVLVRLKTLAVQTLPSAVANTPPTCSQGMGMFSSSLYTAWGTYLSAPRYTRLSWRNLRLLMSPWSRMTWRRRGRAGGWIKRARVRGRRGAGRGGAGARGGMRRGAGGARRPGCSEGLGAQPMRAAGRARLHGLHARGRHGRGRAARRHAHLAHVLRGHVVLLRLHIPKLALVRIAPAVQLLPLPRLRVARVGAARVCGATREPGRFSACEVTTAGRVCQAPACTQQRSVHRCHTWRHIPATTYPAQAAGRRGFRAKRRQPRGEAAAILAAAQHGTGLMPAGRQPTAPTYSPTRELHTNGTNKPVLGSFHQIAAQRPRHAPYKIWASP